MKKFEASESDPMAAKDYNNHLIKLADHNPFLALVNCYIMVFKYIDILGESTKGFDDAVQNAIAETAVTVKDIRWADVTSFKVIVSGDKITEYQALMRVAFKVKR